MDIRSKILSDVSLRYYFEKAKWHYYRSTLDRYSDLEYIVKWYRKANNGREPDLASPRLFTEKLQWLKLFYRDERIPVCSSKAAVKDYVAGQGFPDILVPTVGIYSDPREIDPAGLPEKFIVKATHGSGWSAVVRDKSGTDWNRMSRLCGAWLEQNIYVYGREWNYRDQPRLIIIEPLLSDEPLVDYKVMCFNGKARAFQVSTYRDGVKYVDMYDPQWNRLTDMDLGASNRSGRTMEKPQHMERMKSIAEKLAAPYPFVRADFYDFGGKLYLGEMTFFPGSGYLTITPAERDAEFGGWLSLPEPNFNLELLDSIRSGNH